MELSLKGKTALITGGSRGIGLGIATRFAEAGANVMIASRTAEDLAEAAAGLVAMGTPAERVGWVAAHVGRPEDAQSCIATTLTRFGRLDILVNNAGITIDRVVAKMTDDDWQKVIAVNLSGAFFMAQAAVEHMIERGTGRIINVSSVIGETGNIGQVNYAASKSGLFGLTKSLAKEAIFQLNRAGRPPGDGIGLTVNAVTPGFIATDMLATIPDKVLDKIRGQIPVGRLGRPEEIARVVGFLAADDSAYITGQIWAVNGGLDM
jgi:acetoacetyl-CoA reductase/3-oxoacyl-[acyl-carrier protein] reductase